MSTAIPLLPLWAFLICYRVNFTFTFSINNNLKGKLIMHNSGHGPHLFWTVICVVLVIVLCYCLYAVLLLLCCTVIVLLCYYLCCPMYWLCVLYHCQRVLTELQLTNTRIPISISKSRLPVNSYVTIFKNILIWIKWNKCVKCTRTCSMNFKKIQFFTFHSFILTL